MADEPLGLTVHSMPTPEQTLGVDDERRTRSGRIRMLLVMLVCAAPVIASYFTYYVIKPKGSAGYGQLIEPQRPLPAIAATAALLASSDSPMNTAHTTAITAMVGNPARPLSSEPIHDDSPVD